MNATSDAERAAFEAWWRTSDVKFDDLKPSNWLGWQARAATPNPDWNNQRQAEINDWFLSLPEGRQKALLDGGRWELAGAAFNAGRALPIDFKQATDQGGWQLVDEGCTPADARMLRAANHGLADENSRLREALQFYADGNHFAVHEEDAWDTVSGEPANFYEDEANTATVEDGSVAKMALVLQSEAAPTLLGVADGDAVGGKLGGEA